MRKYFWTGSACALLLGSTAWAQDNIAQDDDVIELQTISVTANRTATEENKTGSTVEQITQAQIEAKSLPVVSDYLNLLPGVSIANNGGLGARSGLFIRGLGSGYVKTLYNGIDISDPSNTQVQTHYQHLLTGGINNIEVLKGSQSTLYGSNAIAGLVDISTMGEAESGLHHIVEAEGGSFGTVRGRYGFTAANEGSHFATNISGLYTDGISAAAGFPERDGYKNATVDLVAEHRINEAFSVFGSALYIDAKAQYDNEGADNLVNEEISKSLGGRAGFNLDLMDGRLKNTFSIQGFKVDREDTSEYGGYISIFRYIGQRQKFDYQGSFEVNDAVLLQYGLDHERQQAKVITSPPTNDKYDLTGVWGQAILSPLEDLVITAGLRHDEHSEFGGHTTYRGTASYTLSHTGTRLHSSFGTGFRAPSLYELYAPPFPPDPDWGFPGGPVGNVDLKPETSKSFDIGIGQSFWNDRLVADVTYFSIDVDNLIIYGNGYEQVPGTTRSRGVETSFTYAATDWLDIGGSYTYTDSKSENGERNSRIPRHAFVLSTLAKPAEKWTIGADLKFAADIMDGNSKLDDYLLLNARVAYQLTDSTEVYLRGENLLNEKYQTVKGYGTPGISAFAGIKAKF
ncbi:TonB-dependent receptor plug domain-containing protein [Aquamicrobium segne]|uniref:TonB-dependent receptor plug domain-containing protein n=1 Tax=Aquamicrobium segne TaxID=469547 RepID=A0ABW0GZ50_9HYPH